MIDDQKGISIDTQSTSMADNKHYTNNMTWGWVFHFEIYQGKDTTREGNTIYSTLNKDN